MGSIRGSSSSIGTDRKVTLPWSSVPVTRSLELLPATRKSSVVFKQEKLLENPFSSNFQHFSGFFLLVFSSIFAAKKFSSNFFSSNFSRRKLKKIVSSNYRREAADFFFSIFFQQFWPRSGDFFKPFSSNFFSNFGNPLKTTGKFVQNTGF